MFKGNQYLKNIDISHFYTDKMTFCDDIFYQLPENGIITINLQKTSALILNQIPDDWIKIKYFDNNIQTLKLYNNQNLLLFLINLSIKNF